MALHKKPYGLVYNDDGSLCVTLRKDDVPFLGVASFAVEEGTTNYYQNPLFEDGLTNWIYHAWGGVGTVSAVNIETPFGDTAVLMDNSASSTNLSFAQAVALPNDTSTYTASAWVKNPSSTPCTLEFHNGVFYETVATIPPNSDWMRVSVTFNPPGGYTELTLPWRIPSGTRLYLTAFQFEQKPFATSFTEGTRPAGILKIPGVRDFTSKVVTAWFKINYVRNYPRIFDMSDGSTNATKGWSFYYDHVAGVFCFGVGSTVAKLTYSNPTNKWFYVVLIFNNGTYAVKLFDDSGLIWDYSFTATMPDLTNNIFKIGNVDSSGGYARPLNGPIAAPHIAEYKPSIWTAEYIQELYNMRRPFSVPPRMPII